MLARLLAHVALAVAVFLTTLGNFWFTYGVWPKSWGSFVLFTFLYVLIVACQVALREEERKK